MCGCTRPKIIVQKPKPIKPIKPKRIGYCHLLAIRKQ